MKVAIWGSYNHGNYGDDLMAIQFANYFKQLGAHPCVYRLDHHLAQKYSIALARSLDELLDYASFGVIGGGGMLVGKNQNPNHTDILEQDFHDLYLASAHRGCKFFPISVGGDGRGIDTPLSHWKEQFWKSKTCGESTVRLPGDVALIEKLGKNAAYHPDILFNIAEAWDIAPTSHSDGKLHVGINIGKSKINYCFAAYLSLMARMNQNIVFHFIRTHLPNSTQSYELLPKINSPYIKHHIYTDPHSTLNFLAGLDLLVSSKLHLGLTALALQIPFYSYEGQGKTRTFLRSIDADFAIFSRNELFKLTKLITNAERIKQVKTRFNFTALEGLKIESRGHINFIQELVNNYR